MKVVVYTLFLLTFATKASVQIGFDPEIAFEMLRASSASYCSGLELENMTCGDNCDDLKDYTFLHQFVHRVRIKEFISYSLFVNLQKRRFVVAFRGTNSPVELIDEIMRSGAVNYTLYNITNAKATRFFYVHYVNHLRDSLLTHLKAAIVLYSDFDFFFVGHSLGGAFATLAILDVSLGQLIPKEKIHMYNYGSPRIGNAILAQAASDNIGGEYYRIVHYKDIVPHIPPCIVNSKGECSPDGKENIEAEKLGIYYAFHIPNQIFYDTKDGRTYKECIGYEDTTCSNQFKLKETSIVDHLHYFGVRTGCKKKKKKNREDLNLDNLFLGNF